MPTLGKKTKLESSTDIRDWSAQKTKLCCSCNVFNIKSLHRALQPSSGNLKSEHKWSAGTPRGRMIDTGANQERTGPSFQDLAHRGADIQGSQ